MNRRTKKLGLLAALPILLAGCASAQATGQPSSAKPMSPGCRFAGHVDVAGHVDAGNAEGGGPIGDRQDDLWTGDPDRCRQGSRAVRQAAGHGDLGTCLYTCTYRLPAGRLVISVKESGTVPSAHTYFTALRGNLGASHTLRGLPALGLPAYETTDGTVVFVKDDKTLHVDGTGLPRNAANGESRTNLAYTIATDILGCWNGK